MNYVDGRNVCNHCLNEYYTQCDDCGSWHKNEDIYDAHDRNGYSVSVCESCLENYSCCDECDEYYPAEVMVELVRENGEREYICISCSRDYETCPHCGKLIEACGDGTCPNCGAFIEQEDDDEEKEEAV